MKYEYKTPIKKLILNQFGAALLGIMMFTASRNSVAISILTSVLSVSFYLVINYTSMWDIGAKDRLKVDAGRLEKNILAGLKSSLLTGIPNFILGILCILGSAFDTMANKIVVICRAVAMTWESMYAGILWCIFPKTLSIIDNTAVYAYKVVENPLGTLYMSLYLWIAMPAVISAMLGYIAGYNNFYLVNKKKKTTK